MLNLESEQHILKNVSHYEIVYESMAINRKTGIFLQPRSEEGQNMYQNKGL